MLQTVAHGAGGGRFSFHGKSGGGLQQQGVGAVRATSVLAVSIGVETATDDRRWGVEA